MNSFSITRNHNPNLTSYDVLKGATLIAMIVFHLWYFFFRGLHWFYVSGMLWPVWFFLIGYARNRTVPLVWLGGGAALVFSAMLAGSHLFPLNILFTFALIRCFIDPVARFASRGPALFALVIGLLMIVAIPSLHVLEYGAFGLLWSLYGYMRRNPVEFRVPGLMRVIFGALLVFITVAVIALFLPLLPAGEYAAMFAAAGITLFILSRFEPVCWTELPRPLAFFVPAIQFCGRWTFEIYVLHLIAFRAIAFFLYPMQWHLLGFRIFAF